MEPQLQIRPMTEAELDAAIIEHGRDPDPAHLKSQLVEAIYEIGALNDLASMWKGDAAEWRRHAETLEAELRVEREGRLEEQQISALWEAETKERRAQMAAAEKEALSWVPRAEFDENMRLIDAYGNDQWLRGIRSEMGEKVNPLSFADYLGALDE